MEIVKERRAGPKRIGELLVAANVIRPEVLMEALQIAKKSTTPLGRVLMSIGEISESDLQVAIEVQSLLREGVIANDFGIKALNLACKSKIPLEEAFRRLGWQPPQRESMSSNELGELLQAAGVVTSERMEEAVRQSHENNLPVGVVWCSIVQFLQRFWASALTAQVLLRDGKISREQAVEGLRSASRKQQTIEESLQQVGAYKPGKESVRVGDLLTSAGIVTEGDKITAVEVGLESHRQIGDVLVQSGMISNTTLEESLKLQDLVAQGHLTAAQAAEILRTAHTQGVTVRAVLEEKLARKEQIDKTNTVVEFLQLSGILTENDMIKAKNLSQQLSVSLGEVLISTQMVDQRLIDAAIQSQDLVKDEILRPEQVARVLQMCARTGPEFHEALKQVAWDTPDQVADDASAKQKSSWMLKLWSKVKKD